MKTIVLCPNVKRDANLECTAQVKAMLEQAGYRILVSPIYGRSTTLPETPLEQAVQEASLIVTLGGDGTILRIAPLVMHSEVPIVGVNLGHKGFLASLDMDTVGQLLDVAEGRCDIVPRMMLDVQIYREGRLVFTDTAINDAVISGVVQNVTLTTFGDENRIFTFSGDGIIVATPTGATAYSLSAGGPLVEPGAEDIILTPICAHDLAARSFVLEPERRVTVIPEELGEKRCVLSADGRGTVDLRDGDRVIVTKSKYKTLLVHIGSKSFYETAFEKLGERP